MRSAHRKSIEIYKFIDLTIEEFGKNFGVYSYHNLQYK